MPTYNDALETYVRTTFAAEDLVLRQIRERIPTQGLPATFVKPEEGHFLQFLAAASGAQLALEIGTLGGYSGVWITRGLSLQGRLITLEKEARHAAVAQEHFTLAGISDRVEIRIGDAHEMLPSLSKEGPFDFIFVDAEKEGYLAYLNWALENLSAGGIFAAHNVFRHGAILDPEDHETNTEIMRSFNRHLAEDPRLIAHVYPAGDGIAVAVLRA